MKYLVLLAGILTLLCCKKSSESGDCPEHEYAYTYKDQSKIDTVMKPHFIDLDINSGNNKVFIYSHIKDRCAMAYDGGYAESIVFEIPSNVSSFSYSNDELLSANIWYTKSCFCGDIGARQVTQGTIEGERSNGGMWRVRANLVAGAYNTPISFNNSFKPE